jgi:hypothetical protein
MRAIGTGLRIGTVGIVAAAALALAGSSSGYSAPPAITINTSAFCASAQCIATATCTSGLGTCYPSSISVAGGPTTISKVTATLLGIFHRHPDDVDVALQGPTGTSVMLMSDAGGDFTVDQDMSFDDLGVALPDTADITALAGPYKPTGYANNNTSCPDISVGQTPADQFPSGPSSFGANLGAFNNTNGNGTWSLYVVDDCAGGAGAIGSGWSLALSTPTAVTLVQFVAKPVRRNVIVRWRTSSEVDVLGFNVFRAGPRKLVKINRALIAAKGGGPLGGASYRVVDKAVRRGITYTYKLQAVSLGGKRVWQGYARVTAK